MKVKAGLCTFFLFLQALFAVGQWKQEEFIIGTYLDPSLSGDRNPIADSLALLMAKEAGFNLLTGYRDDNFIKIDRSENELYYQLGLATKLGLKMLVPDERFFHLKPFDRAIAEEVKQFYLNLDQKYRSTIYGYRLMDEPSLPDTAETLPWVRFFNQIDPGKISYLNLLPVYGFKTREKYEEYLQHYLQVPGSSLNRLQVVSYDFYPFLDKEVRRDYFYNLEVIRKYANGRPIWYYPNISKHLTYIEPGESHLKFESFCPLTYGAKGIIYFSYESVPKQHPFNFSEALINRQGAPTEKYFIVKKINEFINKVAGPIIIKSDYVGTYHVSNLGAFDKNPVYQLLNPSTPLISHISDNNLLVGAFRDKVNPSKYYFLIANKSLKPVKNIDLFFKGAGPANLVKFASNNDDNPLQSQQLALTYIGKLNKAKTTLDNIEGGGMVVLEATVPGNVPVASRVGGVPNEINGLSISTFPNPVKDGTLIRYSINKPGPITVKVYNLVGQEVKSLVEEDKIHEGEYFINLNTDGLGVGVYTCVLVTKDGKVATKILKVPG